MTFIFPKINKIVVINLILLFACSNKIAAQNKDSIAKESTDDNWPFEGPNLDTTIYKPDVAAVYPGSDKQFLSILTEMYDAKGGCADSILKGNITFSFIVEISGKLNRVRCISNETNCKIASDELLRILKIQSVRFIPAQANGKFVRSEKQFSINFPLQF